MGIDDVLADKQPIIEELTTRLQSVAEGSSGHGGLGLKIVTVQIQEAVVSSTNVWENLQKPFRAERQQVARMAELKSQRAISMREREMRQAEESEELQSQGQIATLRDKQEQESYDREKNEAARRHEMDQQMQRKANEEQSATLMADREEKLKLAIQEVAVNKERIAHQIADLKRQKELELVRGNLAEEQLEHELRLADRRHDMQSQCRGRDIQLQSQEQDVANNLSGEKLQSQLIEQLPVIAKALPQPSELRTVQISPDGQPSSSAALTGLIAGIMGVLDRSPPSNGHSSAPLKESPPM